MTIPFFWSNDDRIKTPYLFQKQIPHLTIRMSSQFHLENQPKIFLISFILLNTFQYLMILFLLALVSLNEYHPLYFRRKNFQEEEFQVLIIIVLIFIDFIFQLILMILLHLHNVYSDNIESFQ